MWQEDRPHGEQALTPPPEKSPVRQGLLPWKRGRAGATHSPVGDFGPGVPWNSSKSTHDMHHLVRADHSGVPCYPPACRGEAPMRHP